MEFREFCDDDEGYLDWRAANPFGYIINILYTKSPTDAYLHRTDCSMLAAPIASGLSLTYPYMKICCKTLAVAVNWAADNVKGPVPRCSFCPDPGTKICQRCGSYELAANGKCPSCDED